jgi:hypothetical protein
LANRNLVQPAANANQNPDRPRYSRQRATKGEEIENQDDL